MSTVGGYHEYTGGCSVHWGVIMSTVGGYHEYTGGCSVHWGVIMSTVGGYHEYTGGCSVHREMFSTLGDTMSTPEVYHDECDIMSTLGGVQYTGGIS